MNSPYLIFPLGILALVLYLLTLSLSRLSVIRLATHRKIWNVLLLSTFFVTAILGLILAIQVNYKIKIPYIKQLLTLHVDFGIGMTAIAVFHFLWHWHYFLNLLKKKRQVKKADEEKPKGTGEINKEIAEEITEDHKEQVKIRLREILPLIVLGFSAILSQIILLREFFLVFSGNELVCGLILANWMIITGTGAFIGRITKGTGSSKNFVFYALVLLGLIPPVTVFLINNLKNIIFQPGVAIGLFQIIISTLTILLPFCLLSGFMFTWLATRLSVSLKTNLIEKAYAFESIGSIIGGGLFSFLFVYFLTTYQILGILLLINILSALTITIKSKLTVYKVFLILASLLFIMAVFVFDLDSFSKKALYKNQELIFLKDTPYGNLAITKTGDQKNFYENNILLFNTYNTIANEEAVHYAMVQHRNPRNVLLISGGISGITDEILKYNVNKIDYVELNPWIFRIGRQYTESLKDRRINPIEQDARLFLKNSPGKYDIVLINLPEPSTAQINRYYTIEFFRLLKEKLNRGAVVSLSLPSTINYISEEEARVNSVIYNTIKRIFKEVLIIPGERNFYIISDGKLSINIGKLIEEKGIDNVYVNQYYLDDSNLKQRSDYILSSITEGHDINTDFRPVSYFNQLLFWISQFNIDLKIVITVSLVILAVLILLISRLNAINLGMFTAGFTASSIEVILIISFQIIYGYVYQTLGIIITIFMAGLATGSLLRNTLIRTPHIKHYFILQFFLAIYSVVLPFIVIFTASLSVHPNLVHIIFFILTFVISFIIGLLFSMATLLQKAPISEISAKVYSVDLVGAAAGALFTSVLLIPVTGILWTSIILGALNALCALITILRNKTIYNIP
jgi:spermidine synthase